MTRRAFVVATLVLCVLVLLVMAGCRQGTGAGPGPQPQVNAEKPSAEKPAAKGEEEERAKKSAAARKAEAAKGLQSTDAHVQLKALEDLQKTLAQISGLDLQDALREVIAVATKTGNDEQVRAAATGILAHAMAISAEAAKTVVALSADPSPKVRETVARSLTSVKPSPVVAGLLAKLVKDPDPGVKAAAVETQSAVLAAAKTPGAIAELIVQLGNPEGDASAKAAINLIIKGGEDYRQVLPYLVAAYGNSRNPRQRTAIIECVALICMGTNPEQEKFAQLSHATQVQKVRIHPAVRQGLTVLVKALGDPHPLAREAACQGLGYLGDERAAPALAAALRDRDPYVRKRAASALVLVPGQAAMAQLNDAALKDPNPEVRRYAVEAVGRINDPTAVQILIAATKDTSEPVRRYAATELGRREAKEALDALIALCADPDEDVRWQAVLAIGDLKEKRATDALVNLLDDPSPQVANAAERALQRLGIAKRKEKYLEPAPESSG
jgi:HEAT repeat protein